MKWIKLLSIALFVNCFTISYAQEAKKSVRIITKTVDKDGNEMVDEKYAEGKEAEKLLKEMDIDVEGNGQVRVEVKTDNNGKTRKTVKVEDVQIKKGDRNEIEIDIDQEGEDGFTLRMNRDGGEEVFHWKGLDNLPEELKQMLEEMDVELDLDDMDFGDVGDFEIKEFNFPSSMGRAALGVRVENSETTTGARVIEVSKGSAAEVSGLKEGDVITSINGIAIEEVNDLIRKIGKYEPEERIEVEYERNGKSKTAKVILKERSY